MKIYKKVAPHFQDYIFNWQYETYLLIGGYGSSKSYNTAIKLILKLLEEKRKILVVRDVYTTLKDSCWDLIYELLEEFKIATDDIFDFRRKRLAGQIAVYACKSPLSFYFTNGSKIIFKGMDKSTKVKSINGVSIVWIEEASEISYDAFKELQGRIRTKNDTMHYILTTNPVSRENWVFHKFFGRKDNRGNIKEIINEEEFYNKRILTHKDVYYHHSLPTDNPWLPKQYLRRLNELRSYDEHLYQIARLGKFGTEGTLVLPQIVVASNSDAFKGEIKNLGEENQFFGFDFGFEESFNAVLSMSVDFRRKILYVWDEIYMNKVTDDIFASLPEMQELKEKLNRMNAMGLRKQISADSEDPKAIQYYRQQGFYLRGCKCKFNNSRVSNTRKVKRFHKIIISPKCKNTISELQTLSYKKDKDGNIIPDQFNIDPHSFSAIWYALDEITLADVKMRKFHTKDGKDQVF